MKDPREDAREIWKNTGLTYSDIKREDILKLRELIKRELQTYLPTAEHSRSMDMRLAKERRYDIKFDKTGFLIGGGIFVAGGYFDHREAVYFSQDGFIGFCGWADSENKLPMIKAFTKWVDYVMNKLNDVEQKDGE